jgi:phosphoglycolate phosphatase
LRYQLVVFDWDGTLMDSTAGIAESIRSAARDLGLPVPAREVASHVIGLGLRDSLRGAVPALPEQRYAEFVDAYRRHFAVEQQRMELFPGVRELLEELLASGRLLAVATGKSRRGLDQALAATDLQRYFAASRCADETTPKPDPAMLLELLDELDAAPGGALMVGDTSHDLEMARGAGVDAVAVSYGAHAGDALRVLAPRACVASVAELRAWLTAHG